MSDRWLRRLAPCPNPSANLFCFPYAGGSAAAFRLWPSDLPASLQVWAPQLPGRANRFREPVVDRMPQLVDALIEALLPHLDRPFAFFGHSMGAAMAFEVAHALGSRGQPAPRHLIVSARRPPHLPSDVSDLHPLPDDEFIAEINRRYGGIPEQLLADRNALALLLRGLRADVHALETFRPPPRRKPLDCPISAFGGAYDRLTPCSHLEAWRSQTGSAFRVRVFPGDHFYLDSHRKELLADLSTVLAPMLTSRAALESAA
jgi:medium-chain acyl-[acyl-carrier-protein] hydrolase